MNTEAQADLFGFSPVAMRRGPGRPRHKPTPELRAKVRQLRAEGASHPMICAAIGITGPTLVLHYHKELGSRSQAWRRWAGTSEVGNVEQD